MGYVTKVCVHGGLGHKVRCKNCMCMGGFEVELPGIGGLVYKFPGSSGVSTQISSPPWEYHSTCDVLIVFLSSSPGDPK